MGQGNKSLGSTPSFQPLPGLPVGQMQQNPEGKESRFHSPSEVPFRMGRGGEVERDAEIELYCNDLVSPLLRGI